MNSQQIQSSSNSIPSVPSFPPLIDTSISHVGSTPIHQFPHLNHSNYGRNVSTIYRGPPIQHLPSNYSTNNNNHTHLNKNIHNQLINESSNNNNNTQTGLSCKYPGFTQMGDGQTKVLMGYMVDNLKSAELEFFRTVMDKFDIVQPHIVEVTVKTYRDFSNKAEVIQLPPPKQIKESKKDGNASNILYHIKTGNIPDSIINEQKEATDNKNNKTSIKDSGVEKKLYLSVLKLMVNMRTLSNKTLDKPQDIVLKVQDSLYYNTIITLGSGYDIETKTGKRYATMKKQIDQKTGLYKKIKKVEIMDEEIYKHWTQYTMEWNDKQREIDNDINNKSKTNISSEIGGDDVDNNDNNNPLKRKLISQQNASTDSSPPSKKQKLTPKLPGNSPTTL